ncbi:hypothetical protein [Thiococcus pfennigii]|uniref:hypothetical protein n=1 Tax=Thiococcus pfennigii TaxID=1057 RepID=UPI00190793E0|nr:hypothetical protein [Thiococcus pfennigii]MBK1732697.1 hypothetical protein [Thiococcus pfennigii]
MEGLINRASWHVCGLESLHCSENWQDAGRYRNIAVKGAEIVDTRNRRSNCAAAQVEVGGAAIASGIEHL